MGSEWIIIIFVALVVLLGAKRLPEVARKFGKAAGEYNKTKNEVQNQFKDFTNTNLLKFNVILQIFLKITIPKPTAETITGINQAAMY